MNRELWQRLKPLFHVAMERDPEDRSSFVTEVCGPDTELRETFCHSFGLNKKALNRSLSPSPTSALCSTLRPVAFTLARSS